MQTASFISKTIALDIDFYKVVVLEEWTHHRKYPEILRPLRDELLSICLYYSQVPKRINAPPPSSPQTQWLMVMLVRLWLFWKNGPNIVCISPSKLNSISRIDLFLLTPLKNGSIASQLALAPDTGSKGLYKFSRWTLLPTKYPNHPISYAPLRTIVNTFLAFLFVTIFLYPQCFLITCIISSKTTKKILLQLSEVITSTDIPSFFQAFLCRDSIGYFEFDTLCCNTSPITAGRHSSLHPTRRHM